MIVTGEVSHRVAKLGEVFGREMLLSSLSHLLDYGFFIGGKSSHLFI
jgi:hypothetical protein